MTPDNARKIAADNHHRTPLAVTDALRTMADRVEALAPVVNCRTCAVLHSDTLCKTSPDCTNGSEYQPMSIIRLYRISAALKENQT